MSFMASKARYTPTVMLAAVTLRRGWRYNPTPTEPGPNYRFITTQHSISSLKIADHGMPAMSPVILALVAVLYPQTLLKTCLDNNFWRLISSCCGCNFYTLTYRHKAVVGIFQTHVSKSRFKRPRAAYRVVILFVGLLISHLFVSRIKNSFRFSRETHTA